jgi:hypothetical protein
VIGYGLARYVGGRSLPLLLISLSVIIVGPLEDVLKGWVRRRTKAPEEPTVELVDKATSAAFLILLFWAMTMIG